jgi:hypothetical protein
MKLEECILECIQITPEIEAAVDELRGMIAERYPEATFAVQKGFHPLGVQLLVTVDIDDTDEVLSVVIDRMVDMQVNEELPVWVVPIRPRERNLAILERQQAELAAPRDHR